MMQIIGISGFQGSGKDTVASILESQSGYEIVSFASILKDVTAILFSWDRELLEGKTKESREFREKRDDWWTEKLGYNQDLTPRLALQLMGTEVIRNSLHHNFWVYALEKTLREDGKYCVTDVRFPNEIAWLKSLGGKLVRVRRGEEPEWWATAFLHNAAEEEHKKGNSLLFHKLMDSGELMPKKFPHVHYSEWAWIGIEFDIVIDNDGDLEDLTKKVKDIL